MKHVQKAKTSKVAKPFNAGTWSNAKYFGQMRSHLRRAFMYWKPMQKCRDEAKRHSQSDNKRLKWEYQCNICKEWYAAKDVQVDHEIPCGTLRCFDDVVPFIRRLTAEEGYQVLCKPCHQDITTNGH